MNRKEYFLLALKNNKHMEVSWLFSAFSITTNVGEKNLKHLDLVQTPAGISFYNKETDSMVNINPEQVTPGQPLLNFKRGIRLKAATFQTFTLILRPPMVTAFSICVR